MGFLEEGTAGTNSYQDWDELKIHVQCASQQERQETQAALKERGDACPSVGGEGGWKSFLEWVKLSGNIETSQADLKTCVVGEGRSRETAVTLEIGLLSGI